MDGCQLDHFSILVRDIDVSVSFYTNVFGFRPLAQEVGLSKNVWLEIGGLDSIHISEGEFGETHLKKDTHFALRVADFDGFVADLCARSIGYCDWTGNQNRIGERSDGFRQVYIQDPDGYWIEVNDHTRNVAVQR